MYLLSPLKMFPCAHTLGLLLRSARPPPSWPAQPTQSSEDFQGTPPDSPASYRCAPHRSHFKDLLGTLFETSVLSSVLSSLFMFLQRLLRSLKSF